LFPIVLFFSLLAALPASTWAQSVQDATQRVKERLPQVDALKGSGEAGEDAAGYLAQRVELGPRQAAIVEAENADRRIIYAAVAARTGQSAEEVGRQRALRIAELARPGVWLQRPDGEWYRKQ
jgi:uncharacterized protein YdbL (DUF1318 family)